MFQTVVVPLDGSTLSERALPYARMLADVTGARLVPMRIVPPPEFPDRPEPTGREKALSDADAYVRGFVIRPEGDTSVEPIAYFGDAATAILDESRARPASLIVMSTHGRSGLSQLVYGSVAAEVIRRAEVPVLVIPRDCNRTWSPERRARVLIPLDGSVLSNAILAPALELAQALRASVTLMRAVALTTYIKVEGYPDPVAVPTEGISAGEAEEYLRTIASDLRGDLGSIETYVGEGNDAPSTIASVAADRGVDLIAMATHGRTGLAQLVMGSVARAVVQQATVPILVVRPPALRETAPA